MIAMTPQAFARRVAHHGPCLLPRFAAARGCWAFQASPQHSIGRLAPPHGAVHPVSAWSDRRSVPLRGSFQAQDDCPVHHPRLRVKHLQPNRFSRGFAAARARAGEGLIQSIAAFATPADFMSCRNGKSRDQDRSGDFQRRPVFPQYFPGVSEPRRCAEFSSLPH